MFDKVSEAAEKLATNVSRRAFLGRLGQGALGLAAVIGGVIALPNQARAGSVGWCLIDNPLPGCQIYPAKSGSSPCPCGGVLVAYKPKCAHRSC